MKTDAICCNFRKQIASVNTSRSRMLTIIKLMMLIILSFCREDLLSIIARVLASPGNFNND